MIKVRVKTLEELISTQGVWESEYGIEHNEGFGEFNEGMHKMCGEVIEIKGTKNGLFETMDEEYMIEPWMCSEWNL